MEKKQKYIAPAVLDDLLLEMEGQILHASVPVEDTDFEEVETVGQEVGVIDNDWTHTW